MLIQHSVYSDWLFNTKSIALQTNWFILEINEKATQNIKMLFWYAYSTYPTGLTSSFQTAK